MRTRMIMTYLMKIMKNPNFSLNLRMPSNYVNKERSPQINKKNNRKKKFLISFPIRDFGTCRKIQRLMKTLNIKKENFQMMKLIN